MTLVYLTLGWLAGLLLATWKPNAVGFAPFLLLSGFLLAVLLRRNFSYRTLALCLVAAGLGFLRFTSAQPQFTDTDLASYNDQGYAGIVRVVVDAPDVRDHD